MPRNIITLILIILLLFGGVAVFGVGFFINLFAGNWHENTKREADISFDWGTQPVTDISRYQEIRRQFGTNTPLVKHFPWEIPRDAQNARFYFLPRILQGATIFQLRMKLPADKIKTLETQFLKVAKRKYIPGGKHNSPLEETSPTGLGITYKYNFVTGDSSNTTFPPSYEILVLEDTRGAPQYDWNHPELYGVAIDRAASEIVYWAEDW